MYETVRAKRLYVDSYEKSLSHLEQGRRLFPDPLERKIEDPYRRNDGPREDVRDKIRKVLESRKRMKRQQGGE